MVMTRAALQMVSSYKLAHGDCKCAYTVATLPVNAG